MIRAIRRLIVMSTFALGFIGATPQAGHAAVSVPASAPAACAGVLIIGICI